MSRPTGFNAILHAHSTWSYDGHWPLDRITPMMRRLGARVVMMSEHDTGFDPDSFDAYRAECAAASTPQCTLVPGIEYSCPENDIHILVWGLDRFLAEHRPVMETLVNVHDLGGVAVFAHPVRRDAWAKFDPAWIPYLSGIELWNRKSDGIAPGMEAQVLLTQSRLPPTTGLDFHRRNQLYPLLNHVPEQDSGDIETVMVNAIRDGKLQPRAFGQPITPRATAIHTVAERARKSLRRLIKGT